MIQKKINKRIEKWSRRGIKLKIVYLTRKEMNQFKKEIWRNSLIHYAKISDIPNIISYKNVLIKVKNGRNK